MLSLGIFDSYTTDDESEIEPLGLRQLSDL